MQKLVEVSIQDKKIEWVKEDNMYEHLLEFKEKEFMIESRQIYWTYTWQIEHGRL